MGGGSSTQATQTTKPFDLAQSLEVAEHLDKAYAQNFISLLTSLSSIILFSAAIPHQDGTHHINCQPPSYWAKMFAQHDFECYDILRMRFWDNEAICCWYRQNAMIFAHKSKRDLFADFSPTPNPPYLIHYELWEAIDYFKSESERWRKKYHRTLPKRIEIAFKAIRAKVSKSKQ